MSAPSARRLAAAGSLTLALALASPAAAFAAPNEGSEGRDDRTQSSSQSSSQNGSQGSNGNNGQSTSSSSSQGKSSSSSASKGTSSSAGSSSSSSSRGTSSSSQGSSGSSSSSKGKSSTAPNNSKSKGRSSTAPNNGKAESNGTKAQGSEQSAGDPQGNNGTVKIDGQAFDDGLGNEPHVGCVFQVDFYGFDAGDTATITFTGQEPTGGGLLHSETRTLISDDAAGGGQDRDATLTYSVSSQLSELLAIAPHPQQGWHVKLAVDVDSAPGGAKQKVFWIDCPQPTAVAGTTTAAGTVDTTTAAGTAGTTTAAGTAGTTATRKLVDRAALAPTFGQGTTSVDPTAVRGTTTRAARGAGAATVSARGAARPSVLPFTGTQGLAYLLALGLSAVGVGTAAHRLGRRRATV